MNLINVDPLPLIIWTWRGKNQRLKGNFRAACIGVSTEERLAKIERDIEVLKQQMGDLLERFLKYVQDVDEDPVKD